MMTKDANEMSSLLDGSHAAQAIINKVFIKGFHALYKTQIDKLQTTALFDTGASINAISFKFFSTLQQQLKVIPTNRKVVSADGNNLGPVGEIHIKFKICNLVFNNRCDIILGLSWQQN